MSIISVVSTRASSNFSRWGIRLLGLALSITIAVYLLSQINVQQFVAMIQGIPLLDLILAFFIYMLLNLFRAARFRVLLGGSDLSTQRLYPIALYHNFLVRTLPFKTGEVSYVVTVHHYLRKPVVEGVGSLVSARLLDLVVVASGCTIGLLTLAVPDTEHILFTLFVPCPILGAVSLYFSASLLRRGLALMQRLSKNRRWQTSRLMTVAEQKLLDLIEHLQRIQNPRIFAALLGYSVCIYAASASFNLLLLHALGIDAAVGTLIVVVSIAMFAEALPFSIPGLGLVEGGWTLGLVTLAHLTTSQAVATAFFH